MAENAAAAGPAIRKGVIDADLVAALGYRHRQTGRMAMWSHGSFYWNELMTRDVEQAKKFYGSSIGWGFDAMPMPNGTYWVAKMGDKPVAGIFPLSGPEFEGVPESWMSYLAVDDVDARPKAPNPTGAKVTRAPFDVPDVGRIAILKEPGGAGIGWITPVSDQ